MEMSPSTAMRRPATTHVMWATTIMLLLGSLVAGLAREPATAPPPSPAASATVPAPIDAAAVLAALQRAGLAGSGADVQTDLAEDPNQMMGTPDAYVSRASFDLPGGDPAGPAHTIERGAVIEVFADEVAAEARLGYIEKALAELPYLGTEYHYLNGTVLVRVVGTVRPDTAGRVGAVVSAL